ncbi:hypothetical protein QR680_002830 [Steinernema hermaphroditum]|uniref:Uncharacterized protein n=1 Tax=Steinernema hermaphroditum TaxID=289476 RepID=A0AA39LIY5_9BILA|nr:hypothetical protein QR680_002830 [Steinernema hermaphroditum]
MKLLLCVVALTMQVGSREVKRLYQRSEAHLQISINPSNCSNAGNDMDMKFSVGYVNSNSTLTYLYDNLQWERIGIWNPYSRYIYEIVSCYDECL